MSKNTNVELAERGKNAAERFLYKKGLDILERDWECEAGSVDIVARENDTLVFFEVKTRMDNGNGFPDDGITEKKRNRLEKIALAYLAKLKEADLSVRFDQISIVVMGEDRAFIRHHIGAYSVM